MSQFADERAAELKQLFFETALELLQSLNDETLKHERGGARLRNCVMARCA